jgi:DUF1009 family protein
MTAPRHQEHALTDSQRHAPVGLLAGWGRLPLAIAEALQAQGRRVVGLGVHDHADPALADKCDEFAWIGMASVGRAIRLFRRWGVRRAIMAGKIHKVELFRPGWWRRHCPDWKGLTTFSGQLFSRCDRKDDTLLLALVDAFNAAGIVVEPATNIAPELLVNESLVAGQRLSAKQYRDVQFGWQIARQMGALDIGQTICVKNQAVLAVEAIEGTDACIRRAGELCARSGFTVIKVAKPAQDMRFDVPTVGLQTLDTLAAAGGDVLAIEANRSILLDAAEFRRRAQRLRISVTAVREPAAANAAA